MGVLGLFLMLVVARLAGPAYDAGATTAARINGFAARRVIDGVALVGWLFDHIPVAAAR